MPKKKFLSDIEIARKAKLNPIEQIAKSIGVEKNLEMYGPVKAKISLEHLKKSKNKNGKLILVTAISPTPAGEGKTTTTIGLGDAMNHIGKNTIICLREPSMGPCFGMKGGAAGGGKAQVVPMEDINLHFTGDFHAISIAHNLLLACLDNHLHQGNALNIDPRRITLKRVVDMNDRALRNINLGLGGVANSVPRESGFDITVASEVMAIFCLSKSLNELKKRLGDIVVAYTYKRKAIKAKDLNVHGAMTVLLKDAFKPNLVQTLENNPAIIHGGPFANIAHGCNSIVATQMSMQLADYTVTEAGFGADLGAEKFLNIKCRQAGIKPDAVVIVATVKALKMHGGVAVKDLTKSNLKALQNGLSNLKKHIENIQSFGLPVVVAINAFSSDTREEINTIKELCAPLGVDIVEANHWANGGKGAVELAKTVVDIVDNQKSNFKLLYPNNLSLLEKVKTVATKIYGASDITAEAKVIKKFKNLEKEGYGNLPVCMAKTQYSFSADPKLMGSPKDFKLPIKDIHLSAGAGFVVILIGDIMTMPGLPLIPAAESIDLNSKGEVIGLF
jgi:formate--tetrahydrofolate ligase